MLIRVLRYRGRAPDTITEAEFSQAGGTIGRSSGCTLALPDPERHVSRIQAEIKWSGRKFLLVGCGAANPIERNGEPVAAGQTAELADGDELHIGDYVLRVEFEQTKTEMAPGQPAGFATPPLGEAELFATRPAPVPDQVSDVRTQPGTTCSATTGAFRSWDNPEGSSQTLIVGKSTPGTGTTWPDARPLDSPEKLAALVERAADAHRRDFVPIPKSRTTGFLQELNRKVLDAGPDTAARGAAAAPADLLQALLCGAGLPDLSAGAANEETMLRIGALLRGFAQAFVELLAARAALKSAMRAEMTVISPEGNNPLKFSPDADAALVHLLAARPPRGYMKPEEAVRDAAADLVAHQHGVLAGARAAQQALLQRLSPEALESRLGTRSVLDAMLPVNRKARLWELFEEIHAGLSRAAQEDVEDLFGREFVQAYEAQAGRRQEKD